MTVLLVFHGNQLENCLGWFGLVPSFWFAISATDCGLPITALELAIARGGFEGTVISHRSIAEGQDMKCGVGFMLGHW